MRRKRKRIPNPLSFEDVMDAEIEIERGHLVDFAVNYRAKIRGTWYEIIRYDTAHGAFHVHRFWRDGKDQVRILEETRPTSDRSEQHDQARKDVVKRWAEYRAKYERRLESD